MFWQMWTKKEFLTKTVKLLCHIREVFIPILENAPEEEIKAREKKRINAIKDNCKKITTERLDDTLKLASQAYEDEENRRKNAESKSSIFISSLGVTISILTAVFLTLLKDFSKLTCEYPNWVIITIIICFIILILYLCTTVFYAIMTLGRRDYYVLSSTEIIAVSLDENFKCKLIETYLEYTERNHDVTNCKMGNMIQAHAYFKRSIVSVALIAVLIAVTLIFL